MPAGDPAGVYWGNAAQVHKPAFFIDAVQKVAEDAGYSVVREFVGHGIGERRLLALTALAIAVAIGARGSAIGDLDLDGATDVVLARIDAPAALGMNRMGSGNHRLALRLVGSKGAEPRRTPADGMGARAVVVVGDGPGRRGLLAEVQTACGYQSASTPWLHFGLGRDARVDFLAG